MHKQQQRDLVVCCRTTYDLLACKVIISYRVSDCVESCQELCLPVSIADFLLNIKFLLCGFRDSMISQAITGKTIWDTWKICMNTMLDIGLLSLATKRKGQIHSGRSQCYTIKWVVQASKSMYCQYGPELLIVEWPMLWRITINFLHNESIL